MARGPLGRGGEGAAAAGARRRGGRLPPAEPGNALARRHGAYATLSLAPRARAIAAGLGELVPARTRADEPAVCLLAICLAQIEAAAAYVGERGLLDRGGQPQPILRYLATLLNTAGRYCDRLGLTPLARAQLGLEIARTAGEARRLTLAELAQLAEQERGSGE